MMSKLQIMRESKDLTMGGLSSISGVSRICIKDIEEAKRKPYWSTLVRLAAALECSPHDIDDETDRNNLRICPICGVEFSIGPNIRQTTCGKPECTSRIRSIKVKSRYSGEGPNHRWAKDWTIATPHAETLEVRNLKYWLRYHPQLLDGTPDQAYAGINIIKYGFAGQWKGWKLVKHNIPEVPEHMFAHNWVIQSPDGTVYEFLNLSYWVHHNKELLPGTPEQAYAGISRMMQGKQNAWKGWTIPGNKRPKRSDFKKKW